MPIPLFSFFSLSDIISWGTSKFAAVMGHLCWFLWLCKKNCLYLLWIGAHFKYMLNNFPMSSGCVLINIAKWFWLPLGSKRTKAYLSFTCDLFSNVWDLKLNTDLKENTNISFSQNEVNEIRMRQIQWQNTEFLSTGLRFLREQLKKN